jgi:hypothetical protein
MFRKWSFIVFVGVLAVFGISAALAQDGLIVVDTEEAGRIVGIGDGRLNAFDQAAPVAIYYTNVCSDAGNAQGLRFQTLISDFVPANECTRLDILKIDPVTGNGLPGLELFANDISGLFAEGDTSITDNGVTLNIREDGQYWVTTAPDFEGKVYTFAWFDDGRTLLLGSPFLVSPEATTAATAMPTATAEATEESS